MKTCSMCKEQKPITEFNWKNKSKNIRHYSCRKCSASIQHKSYVNNKDRHRRNASRWRYKNVYNAPQEVIDKLMESTSGNCEICNKECELFVDHCHTKNTYRGLLCRECNLMLGYAKDNLDTLLAGVSYLQARG